MTGWRILAGGLVMVMAAGAARAQAVPLAESPLTGSYFHVEITMSLEGSIQVQQEGKSVTLKQSAHARHDYAERILEAGVLLADKSARVYQSAHADISTNQERATRTFRDNRRFLVAQRVKDQTITYCPLGPLTGNELELTDHFDTLALPGLLPGRAVKVGDSWKVANAAAQTLLDLDGLVSQDLTCKLDKVANNLAQVSVTGTAAGIDMGASVKLKIAGFYQFDLKARRLIFLEWKQNDQR